ncbi:UNVERIFIED_CONTAM: hypothetical protein NCL1_03963 [Trichonephila clavipes]
MFNAMDKSQWHQMTTKEMNKRSLISSTDSPNQGAATVFALIPWVHRWDHPNGLILCFIL